MCTGGDALTHCKMAGYAEYKNGNKLPLSLSGRESGVADTQTPGKMRVGSAKAQSELLPE
jgi:hypothetical protein